MKHCVFQGRSLEHWETCDRCELRESCKYLRAPIEPFVRPYGKIIDKACGYYVFSGAPPIEDAPLQIPNRLQGAAINAEGEAI